MTNCPLPTHQNQTGAALILALILLAAITIISLSNMQSSSMEMKMITSMKQRNEAFAIAEGALINAEDYLENTLNLTNDDLYTDKCTISGKCFTSTCTDGLCFDGEYDSSDYSKALCDIAPDADTVARKIFWQDETLWADNTKYKTITTGAGSPDAKFIIEFLCFIDEDYYLTADPSAADPLFRLTVLFEPDTGSAPIMLQSTYSFDL